MSDYGYFFIDRGVWDHPLFAREPFTEREAWLWMISAAAWKATKVRCGRKIVQLARGQLVFSERFLAEKWRWAKTTVRRFIERLKSEAMVSTLADRNSTLITICNYDKYQLGRTTDGPQTGPPTGPLADHSRTKEEEINNLTNKKLSSLRSESAHKRGSRLTAEWRPLAEDRQEALARLGSTQAIEQELLKFHDYWKAQPGQRGIKLDWDATWRNWVRNAKGPQGNGRRTVQDAARDLHESLLDRIAEFDEPAPRSLCGPEGSDVVRLLPARGGE